MDYNGYKETFPVFFIARAHIHGHPTVLSAFLVEECEMIAMRARPFSV